MTQPLVLSANGKQLILDKPHVMGILNVTPDSFSDGGKYTHIDNALYQAEKMIAAGATIIDIGGESTRPGATDVSVEQELQRVTPAIEAIRQRFDVWISLDTSKAAVMEQGIKSGIDLINDVRSFTEPGALQVAAQSQLPVCIMHMQGQPQTMQLKPEYEDVNYEVHQFLSHRVEQCIAAGIERSQIILDPGFGFGKTLQHNYHLLANFEAFHRYNLPLLAGMSRKSMVHNLLNKAPADCVVGSVTCAALAALKGAHIIRVHDVQQTQEAMTVIQAVLDNQ